MVTALNLLSTVTPQGYHWVSTGEILQMATEVTMSFSETR